MAVSCCCWCAPKLLLLLPLREKARETTGAAGAAAAVVLNDREAARAVADTEVCAAVTCLCFLPCSSGKWDSVDVLPQVRNKYTSLCLHVSPGNLFW